MACGPLRSAGELQRGQAGETGLRCRQAEPKVRRKERCSAPRLGPQLDRVATAISGLAPEEDTASLGVERSADYGLYGSCGGLQVGGVGHLLP